MIFVPHSLWPLTLPEACNATGRTDSTSSSHWEEEVNKGLP